MVELQLAQLDYICYDFDLARRRAESAFGTLRRQGRRRAAALAAAAIGRIYLEGLDNQAAARGWFARGATLGEVTFKCGDQILEAGPGAFVFLPRGIPHTFVIEGGYWYPRLTLLREAHLKSNSVFEAGWWAENGA